MADPAFLKCWEALGELRGVADQLAEALREIDERADGGISTIKGRAALTAYDALQQFDGEDHG